MFGIFFFKQKTAYEMRISDWSSDVCSSDLEGLWPDAMAKLPASGVGKRQLPAVGQKHSRSASRRNALLSATSTGGPAPGQRSIVAGNLLLPFVPLLRSEEHTSELQSLMRISYAVFCLKKKKTNTTKQQ